MVHVLNVDAADSPPAVADALQRPEVDHPKVRHVCEDPTAIDPETAQSPLLPPIDHYGWTALDQPTALTRRSMSRLARRTAAGQLLTHRAIAVPIGDKALATAVEEPVLTYTDQQWQHGIDERAAARTELDALAATLDDIDARIAELAARTQALLEGDLLDDGWACGLSGSTNVEARADRAQQMSCSGAIDRYRRCLYGLRPPITDVDRRH